jgi:hypothetical protein
MWTSDREIVSQRAGSERIKSFGVARVSAKEHITTYRAARALADKGRNAGEGAAGLSGNGLRKQTAGLSKSSAKKSAVKKAKPKK